MILAQFRRRLRFLLNQRNERQALEEEMRLHRDLRTRQMMSEGVAPVEASFRASRLFGNQTLLKERANDMWGWNWLEDLSRDLRQTGRMLTANPGFASVAVLTLALGIGANTGIFSVTNALLLRGLPVPDPQQLYRVSCDRQPNQTSNTGDYGSSFSLYVFEQLRKSNSVSELVAYVPLGYNKISVRTAAVPLEAAADMVSGNFFSGLGVQPACGRLLSADDASNHAPVAVLSYEYAVRLFGEPCSAVGRPVSIRSVPFTIIGISGGSFTGTESNATDLWIPFQVRPELNAWGESAPYYSADPSWWCLRMIARVKPEISKAAAEAALNPPFRHAAYEPVGGKPAQGERPPNLHLQEARGVLGYDASFTRPLWILQAMVGLLLVIACGNVSMILAVRNAARSREFSVRLALGGSQGRLIRQLLAESVLLTGSASTLGLFFAVLITRILARWADLEIGLAPDRTVLLFTLVVSLAAALVFGIAPAFRAARMPLVESIKNSAATAHRDRSKITAGNLTIAVQLALCLMLLVGTGLLVRTLQNLKDVNVGFPTSGLLVFGIAPAPQPAGAAGDAKLVGFYRGLASKVHSVPGVESVTLSGNRLASGWSNNTDAHVDGKIPADVANKMLRWNAVGPDFFTTLGIRLAAGRDFNDSDSQTSAPVAIVNRTFARHFLNDRNPLGHTASYTRRKSFTIVGVVEDSKYTGIQETPIPMAWFPYMQVGDVGAMHVELRTFGPALAILPRVRAAVAGFAPDLALLQPQTQQAVFEKSISTQSLLARLSLAFAAVAITLVAIGLYGTISYSVARRTTEVGIRVALGAERSQVVWMILRSGLLLCVLGLGIGIPLALASGHLLASLLYGVSPTDPASVAGAALGILLISAVATYLPARRAAAIDAMVALRHE